MPEFPIATGARHSFRKTLSNPQLSQKSYSTKISKSPQCLELMKKIKVFPDRQIFLVGLLNIFKKRTAGIFDQRSESVATLSETSRGTITN